MALRDCHCGNPVFHPQNSSSTSRTQQSTSVTSESASEAQINLAHPLTAWLNSHWISRYSTFTILEGQKSLGQQSSRPPNPVTFKFPPFGPFWISTFYLDQSFHILLEPHWISPFPSSYWKLPIFSPLFPSCQSHGAITPSNDVLSCMDLH